MRHEWDMENRPPAFGSFPSIGAIGSINQHMKLLFRDAGLSPAKVACSAY